MNQMMLEFGPPAQVAIHAAMYGDWKPADDMELAFLNSASGPSPYILNDYENAVPDGDFDSALAARIHRGTKSRTEEGRLFGCRVTWAVPESVFPDGDTHVRACPHCESRGCAACGEMGYQAINQDDDSVVCGLFLIDTDIDGAIIAQGDDGRWRHV